ncbi:MAG: YbaB/EbfC family nucleoid-associated protein [Chthoniobacterales bacterium]|jgi:DNA-binding YbaB/EbfC family protein|nr:YbaB/EbfC family nucleoid-associated protein [Chthoniobacterales bacterium]
MNIAKMMKEAQRMQERMAQVQDELAARTLEVNAGGGKIKVTATGAGDIVSIKIDPQVVDPQDVEFLEDLILSGVKQALEEAKALAGNEMGRLTGGLKIPGL